PVEADIRGRARRSPPCADAERRLGVDEAPDEPSAGDAVDVHPLARDPRATADAVRVPATRGARRLLARRQHALLEVGDEPLDGLAPGSPEEVDAADVVETLAEPPESRLEL